MDSTTLSRALTLSTNVSERRGYIPILQNVALHRRAVLATDLDMSLAMPLQDGPRHPCTVDARAMLATVKALPKGAALEIAAGDAGAIVGTSDGPVAVLETLPLADWPSMAAAPAVPYLVDASDFATALARVAMAQSSEETRYYLNGVFLEPRGDMLAMTATDGHRLVHLTVPMRQTAETLPPAVILPRKAVAVALAMLAKAAGPVLLHHAPNQVEIQHVESGATLRSKAIDGTFPDYTRVIPTDAPLWISAPRDALADAAAAFCKAAAAWGIRHRGGCCVMATDDSGLTLSIEHDGNRMVRSIAGARIFSTEPRRAGINPHYLSDLCGIVPKGWSMSLAQPHNDAGCPFRCDLAGGVAVVMPMRA